MYISIAIQHLLSRERVATCFYIIIILYELRVRIELIHFIFVLLKQFLPIVEDKSCLVLASPLLHTEMAARLVLLLSCLCVAATTAVNRGSIQVGREGVRSLV